MTRLAAVVLTFAAACSTSPDPQTQKSLPLRNPTVQVASQLDATQERLSGDWIVVQGAGVAPGTRVRIASGQIRIGDGLPRGFAPLGQGRFQSGDSALWIHWLDVGNRTVALGDPAGTRVWIMDRTATGSRDRLIAARDILGWYGYDLTRLSRT